MDADTLEFARKNFPNLAAIIEGKVVRISATDMEDALRAIRELRDENERLHNMLGEARREWLRPSDLFPPNLTRKTLDELLAFIMRVDAELSSPDSASPAQEPQE